MSPPDQLAPAIPLAAQAAAAPIAEGGDEGRTSALVKVALFVLVVFSITVACSVAVNPDAMPVALHDAIAPLFAVLIATMLATFPLVIGFVQATSQARQIRKLEEIQHRPVAGTTYYQVALSNLRSLRPASVTESDYRVPMVVFCVTVLVCTLSVFVCCNLTFVFDYQSFILGGTYIIGSTTKDISEYQIGTFAAIAYAFVGAYICIIARLLSRINNNDVYPISFHFYSAWIITAGLVAAVLRHVAHLIVSDHTLEAPVLFGFAAGLAPTLFLTAIARRAFTSFNIIGDKDDPARALLPTNMNLQMILGITSNEIDRLSELGIANAQVLGAQNPFALWPRLPFELSLLVDWMAQSQLYVKVGDAGFSTLRTNKISNIFDFYMQLSTPEAQATVCGFVNLPVAMAPPLLASLDADPSFARLKAVRDAMRS